MWTEKHALTEAQHAKMTALVEALESGEYGHAISSLRSDRSYCCLGVVCSIEDNSKWSQHGDHWMYNVPAYALTPRLLDFGWHLPHDYIKVYGFGNKEGELLSNTGNRVALRYNSLTYQSLAGLNDASEEGFVPVISALKSYLADSDQEEITLDIFGRLMVDQPVTNSPSDFF